MRWAAAVLVATAVLQCSGATRREIAALEDGVDAYRRAGSDAKASKADAVSALACTLPAVCAAKTACLDAMAPTTRALLLKEDVTRGLRQLEQNELAADSAEAQLLPAKLEDAARLLADGRAKMLVCDQDLASLRAHVAQ